jgi:hypothetical protein
MHQMRAWASQEIKELQDLEWRIIKQCDLREQLVQERDEVLVQAFGGSLDGVAPFDPARFEESLRVQNLIQDMYRMLYETEVTGRVVSFVPSAYEIPFRKDVFSDEPSEIGRSMLGC